MPSLALTNSLRTIPQNSGVAAYSPSLSLDLTSGNQTLDPRVTFSRTSNATVTGPDGLLGYAPHNLLTYSEQFDNAAWTKVAATISANSTTAPDGTSTADKIAEDTATNQHRVNITATTVSGATHTLSVYVKVAERSRVRMRCIGTSGFADAIFNLNTDQVTFGSGVIQDVGNGWKRLSISGVSDGTSTVCYVNVLDDISTLSYTGTTGFGLFVWGAQLNVGALQPYYPTTVKNLLGYTQEFDNAAWTKSNSFVQMNLLLQSADLFETGTGGVNWIYPAGVITSNTQVAPDGTTTADTLTTTGGAQSIYQSATVSASTVYTFTVYAKLGTMLAADYKIAVYNNSTPGFIVADVTPSQTPTTTGWTRIQYSFTTPVGCTSVRVYPFRNSVSLSSCTVFLWGAQLVQGAVAGDYQQTTSAAKAVMYSAPDGSVTADKLVENTGSVAPFVTQAATVIAGTPYTLSAYGKEDTASAKRYLILLLPSAQFGANIRITINLATGTYTTVGSPTAVSVTSVGNGWYRANVTANCTVAGSASGQVRMTNDANGSVTAYTGDGTSGIFIWGAQLSDSASLDPYVYNPVASPTPAAYYGPRFDYDPVTLAPKGLLIEEQRTNLVLQSEDLGTTWTLGTGGTLTQNVWNAPNGTVTGDVFTIASDATAPYQSVTVTNSTSFTLSFYFNKALTTAAFLRLRFATAAGSVSAFINVSTNAFATFGAGISNGVVQPVSSNVYRASVTMTYGAADAGLRTIAIAGVTADNSATADTGKNIAIWGMQFEAGAFATSYIPTTTAAATRAADVATMIGANFSNWYRQDEGTMFAEFGPYPSTTNNFGVFNISSGSFNNGFNMFVGSGAAPVFNVRNTSVDQAYLSAGTLIPTAVNKIAGAYAADNFARSYNGTAAVTDASGTVPAGLTQADIGKLANVVGQLNGHISRLAFFPRRLSNTELQGITS